jgi:hypothetical protein
MAEAPKEEVARGIDDKRKLLGFFAAKGHRNLVLRVADLRDLPEPAQYTLITFLSKWGGLARPAIEKQPWWFFLYHAFDGYVSVPFDKLLEAPLERLEELQQAMMLYRDVRRGKGEPSRIEACKCKGFGRCKECDGTGRIVTFVEMSDEERALAEREIPTDRSLR